MISIDDALADQQAELAALLEPLDESGWHLPSACVGWDVSDVVLHLAQGNEMALASVQGTLPETMEQLTEGLPAATSVEEGAGSMVDGQRGAPPSEVEERWRRSVEALAAAMAATDPAARLDWIVGQLAARTLFTTRMTETWIHAGDIAAGLGVELPATERLWHIARLAWRTVPHAFASAGRELAGPVAFELKGPGGVEWNFAPDGADAVTTLRGEALELCLVAGQRRVAADTDLSATGPDAAATLELVRTFA